MNEYQFRASVLYHNAMIRRLFFMAWVFNLAACAPDRIEENALPPARDDIDFDRSLFNDLPPTMSLLRVDESKRDVYVLEDNSRRFDITFTGKGEGVITSFAEDGTTTKSRSAFFTPEDDKEVENESVNE